MARRSRMFRDSTSCTSMSAVSIPTPITRANRRTIACGPSLGACEALALAVGPLGIFVLDCRDRDHLAVITLAPQPTEKGAFEQLGVETIGLGAPVLARYGYARCVDDVGLDVTRPEPTRQPEAVTAGLESDRDAFDPVS